MRATSFESSVEFIFLAWIDKKSGHSENGCIQWDFGWLVPGGSHMNACTAPFSSCGAWRIDKEGEDEEFVLFRPYEFLRSLRLAKSKMIRDFVPPTEKNKLFIFALFISEGRGC
jgi:hypothetical protein